MQPSTPKPAKLLRLMSPIRVTRAARIPDLLRISRCRKAPELGPVILFFSGGSALNGLSRAIKGYTHNSIHMVTPFDSGGSSAKLRDAFAMPSIGDLRSRLMALADESVTGHPEVYKLFTYRFPRDAKNSDLLKRLQSMRQGRDPLVNDISNPMRRLIRNQLGYLNNELPREFDLRGASIGNLILAGGYLNNHHHLDPIIFLFSKLVGVLGTVRAVVNNNLHLCADLADGSRIIGQHLLTGKEVAPLTSRVKRLYLSRNNKTYVPAKVEIRKKNRKLIERAEMICYPPGSFYSSLIANFLPKGVGAAIASSTVPKIYIPNLGRDPEQVGMSMDQSLHTLLEYLRADAGADCPSEKLLNFVLMDSERGDYLSVVSEKLTRKLGIQVIDTRLVSKRGSPYYDPELLVSALLSLI
ncbi:MAG: GAK system CofD-like protein [Pseudomonadota bacterium]|nr:GAK system CofD-like protein [Pseudomonadota bacterium]